ncbi:MAG: putative bifunctional diguanylate cyclase/phosphodiesterase, partial [bacterium]
ERDPLTGLYTKNFFYQYAMRLFLYHPEMHLDAVVVNIDQFHSVNALHGRDFGDEVLRTIGQEIRSFLDGREGISGRCAGDTFHIYCLPQKNYRAVLNRFQMVVNALSPNVNIHLRMGVRPYEKGVDPNLLFDCANAACNRARGDYQNPLVFYDEAMHQRELLNQRLLNDLRAAIEKRQLLVYYQPQYNIQCEPPRLVGAESLVRWKHPELGMVSPGMFVPLLEGNGLIGVVDSFVWEEAARQVAEWKEKYRIPLPVSVNLSRTEISDPTLSERLISLIQDNGLDHRDLKLEVTETAYTDNTKQILGVVRGLQETGFEIEMDDFGSGYSALNMLSDMPLDVLKIDMKFVRNIETSAKDRQLLEIIFKIAQCLGTLVIVEGIETEGQLKILKDGGCDIGQGYYFSPPIPAERFEELIEKELAMAR